MRDLVILFVHLLTTVARLAGRGGVRSVVAESILVKHQLLILNRSRQRAPSLRLSDRLVAGWCALLVRRSRLIRSAIVLKPSTLLRLHQALRNRKQVARTTEFVVRVPSVPRAAITFTRLDTWPSVRKSRRPQLRRSALHALECGGSTPLFPRDGIVLVEREYSFILLHTSADKRSGGVSGALRGGQGRETGHGARDLDSPLSPRHSPLATSNGLLASGGWFA